MKDRINVAYREKNRYRMKKRTEKYLAHIIKLKHKNKTKHVNIKKEEHEE